MHRYSRGQIVVPRMQKHTHATSKRLPVHSPLARTTRALAFDLRIQHCDLQRSPAYLHGG
jgi:hypothetical protein